MCAHLLGRHVRAPEARGGAQVLAQRVEGLRPLAEEPHLEGMQAAVAPGAGGGPHTFTLSPSTPKLKFSAGAQARPDLPPTRARSPGAAQREGSLLPLRHLGPQKQRDESALPKRTVCSRRTSAVCTLPSGARTLARPHPRVCLDLRPCGSAQPGAEEVSVPTWYPKPTSLMSITATTKGD